MTKYCCNFYGNMKYDDKKCWLMLPDACIFVLPWCISTYLKWCENFKQIVLHLKEHQKATFSVSRVVLPKFN